MKKLFAIFGALMILMASCADSMTFNTQDADTGVTQTITAEPYGWMNQHKKIEGVEYQICVGNVVWDILLCETIVVPVVLTGVALYEPVKYTPPGK
jgi:hypothetical protein